MKRLCNLIKTEGIPVRKVDFMEVAEELDAIVLQYTNSDGTVNMNRKASASDGIFNRSIVFDGQIALCSELEKYVHSLPVISSVSTVDTFDGPSGIAYGIFVACSDGSEKMFTYTVSAWG